MRDMNVPKLRPIEAFPFKDNLICLRDPQNYSDKLLLVPPDVFFICTFLDGEHSVLDIQTEYTRKFGNLLFSNKVEEIIDQLDSCLFLETERFYSAREEAVSAFKTAKVRTASHAGTAYEAERESLLKQLEGSFSPPDGPGKPATEAVSNRLRAIIAPHIDLRRGGPCFAYSYAEVARESQATTFIILGICHTETRRRFVLTGKDFETPLGKAETDGDLLECLTEKCTHDFYLDEFAHRNEHSIEFQVLFLQYIFRGVREFRILPVLCSSLHSIINAEGSPLKSPMSDPEVREFIEALKTVCSEKREQTCLIGGVDLSHIGQRFGHSLTLSRDLLDKIETEDRKMLQRVLDRDAEGFFELIRNERDGRNVCGVPAIYALLHAACAGNSRLLRYDQNADQQTQSVVSFASLALYA